MQIPVGKDIVSYRLSGLPLQVSPTVVVFLHGWGRTKEDFDQLAASLDGYFRLALLQIDLPGFGGSPRSGTEGLSLTDYAGILKSILEKLAIPKVIIIGHSFGARIAIRFAFLFPAKVDKLVLISAAGIQRRLLRHLLFAIGRALFKTVFFAVQDFRFILRLKNLLGTIFGSADYRTASAQLRETLKKTFAEDLRQEAARITLPTLLIWGQQDQITPLRDGKIYQALIPNSRLEILACGHFPFLEVPDECSRLITSFLEQV